MVPAILLVLAVLISNAITLFVVKWITNRNHEINIKHKLDSIAEQEITSKENKIAQLKKENKIYKEENIVLYDIVNTSLVLNNQISQKLMRVHEKK